MQKAINHMAQALASVSTMDEFLVPIMPQIGVLTAKADEILFPRKTRREHGTDNYTSVDTHRQARLAVTSRLMRIPISSYNDLTTREQLALQVFLNSCTPEMIQEVRDEYTRTVSEIDGMKEKLNEAVQP